LSPELQKDPEIKLAHDRGVCLDLLSPEVYQDVINIFPNLKGDKPFMLKAVKQYPGIIQFADPSVWDDQFMKDILNATVPDLTVFVDICSKASKEKRTKILALLKGRNMLATYKWQTKDNHLSVGEWKKNYEKQGEQQSFYDAVINALIVKEGVPIVRWFITNKPQ